MERNNEPVKQEHTEQYWLHEINNARADGYEREACAAICDRFAERDMHPAECAAAIRARAS